MLHTPHQLGLDVGYSHTKIVWDAHKIKFPSAIVEREQLALANLANNDRTFSVIVKDVEYLIGQSALELGQSRHHEGRNYHLSPEWNALFLAGLTEIALPSGSEVIVATGLPVDFYTKENSQTIKNSLVGRHTIYRNGVKYHYEVVDAIVQVQFYGAAMAMYLSDSRIAELLSGTKPVAVADGGGRTWNMGILSQMRIVQNSTFTEDLGVWNAVKLVKRELQNRFSRPFDDYEVLEGVRRDSIFHLGDQDISDLTKKAKTEQLALPITKAVLERHRWNEVLPTCAALLMCGGTSLLLKNYLARWPVTEIFWGSEFDNAVGYQYFARLLAEKR